MTLEAQKLTPFIQEILEFCAACQEETTHAVETRDGWEWHTCTQCGNSHAVRRS